MEQEEERREQVRKAEAHDKMETDPATQGQRECEEGEEAKKAAKKRCTIIKRNLSRLSVCIWPFKVDHVTLLRSATVVFHFIA